MSDPGCICQGNWRELVAECEPLFDKEFICERGGETYVFAGLVHGSDDYYYLLCGPGGPRLLTCVGSLEGHGYRLKKEAELLPSYAELVQENEELRRQLQAKNVA